MPRSWYDWSRPGMRGGFIRWIDADDAWCFPSVVIFPWRNQIGEEPIMTDTLSREIAIEPKQTALLFIDVQNFAAKRDGAEFKEMPAAEFEKKCGWYFQQLESRVIPNMQRLQAAARKAGIEVMY